MRDTWGVLVHDKKEICMSKMRQRLAAEEGFTLIELLVVIVIIGILLAIAVPSYLGFKDRANRSAAAADVRSAVPSAEAYFSDCNTYADVGDLTTCSDLKAHKFNFTGGTPAAGTGTVASPLTLSSYDSGMKLDEAYGDSTHYCLSKTVNGKVAKITGPGGTVTSATSACSSPTG
jgi:type IV pilus assembly protein PilA